MVDALLQELLAAQTAGEPVVLATVIAARGSVPRHSGSKMLVYPGGRISGTIGGGEMEARVIAEAGQALQDGRPRTVLYSLVDPQRGDPGVCGGEVEIYLEPYMSTATLLVIGCGHVGRAVADLGHWLGFRVAVSDDRVETVTPENIPHADLYLPGPFDQVLEKFGVTADTFVAVVTRNIKVDRLILPLLVDTPAAYIGVIGSLRRWQTTRKLLIEDGMPEAKLARFRSPLGLELNAETPEEIAVSILAEIIMVRRKGSGRGMAE